MSTTMSYFSQWVFNIHTYYKADKKFKDNKIKKAYSDDQIRYKEIELKNLKHQRDLVKTKIEKIRESERILQKNLIVKNKNWVLEGCMRTLLEDGCNPNIKNNYGETLLIDAIKKKKLNSVRLLLKNDCKVSLKNDQGMSPIGQAITSMNHEALTLILEYD